MFCLMAGRLLVTALCSLRKFPVTAPSHTCRYEHVIGFPITSSSYSVLIGSLLKSRECGIHSACALLKDDVTVLGFVSAIRH